MGLPEGAACVVTITEIISVRSGFCIVLDSGDRFWLHKEDLIPSFFIIGKSYEPDCFLRQIRILQYPRALNLAVSMLARRPCSKAEIRTRLIIRRYTDETADLVILKLEKENLLDDKAFCEQWIRFRTGRGYGPSVIRRELRYKGIPDDLIISALDCLAPDDIDENALHLARKAWLRIRPGEDLWKARQKVAASLVRKGYSWDEARRACEKAAEERR